VVGPAKATRLVNLRRHADVIVAIDSAENAAELDAAARAKGVRVRAVVEVDLGMRRCGVLPGPPALELARQVAACRGLEFVGLMGWEGHARRPGDPDERRRNIEAAVGLLVETAELCRRAGLPVAIVSCGGTGTHQVAARVPGVTEIQAGGGVFGDRYYRRNYALDHEPALTVLTTVVSRPAPDRIVVDAGKKTMSADLEAPEPLGLEGVQRVRLSAEHGTIDLAEPNDRVRVGDRITFAVGYSDTTTCLHDEFLGVRDGRVEVVWPILGRGKLR
jgi:D-serine deaminase-like pyridoxal phosphate-dependent protein